MMSPRRQNMAILLLLLGLLAGVGWAASWMWDRRADARRAAEDYATCVQMGGMIRSAGLAAGGSPAGPTGAEELTARIRSACSQAGVSSEANAAGAVLDGKFPQSPRTPAGGGAAVVPTVLSLRSCSAQQVAAFLFHLTDGTRLNVSDLRLRMPRGEATEESWDAEATVTYLAPAGGKTGRSE